MPGQITPPRRHIAIVGGGIGGLALAISLAGRNIPFHIYEAASQFSEIGAGVGFSPNAQHAMHLIDPLVKQAYDRHAAQNFGAEQKDYYFQFRLGMDGRPNTRTEGLVAGHLISSPGGPGQGMSMIHRATFLDELAALLPEGCTSFGKRLQSVEYSDGTATLHFADGTMSEARAVIGCDGVKSKVRQSVFGSQSRPRFTGKYAYRGLISMAKAVGLVGEDRARNSQGYLGYGGHVLTMAVDGGRTMNVVAFKTADNHDWKDEKWVLPAHKTKMQRDFAEWGPEVTKLLDAMHDTDLWALFDHPRLEHIHRENVVLLGDAAHATSPHQGSGAGMAIEDALIMGHLLGLTVCDKDINRAFAAYESVRLERSMKVVETSQECGEVYEFMHERTLDDLGLIDEDLSQRYKWIWNVDLGAQMRDAEALYCGGEMAV
jgi:salicylate hydroxylase